MRLIDADALIADCQLAQKQADRHGREFANAFYSGGGEVSTEWWCVEDMIENTPTIEPEPHWIPCSERLPEERQAILATTTDNAWGDVVIIRTYYKEMHKSVIAWMPLPEAYREGE